MNTSASTKNNGKKAPATKKAKELETEAPLSEKDEVKKAEERTKKQQKGKG